MVYRRSRMPRKRGSEPEERPVIVITLFMGPVQVVVFTTKCPKAVRPLISISLTHLAERANTINLEGRERVTGPRGPTVLLVGTTKALTASAAHSRSRVSLNR